MAFQLTDQRVSLCHTKPESRELISGWLDAHLASERFKNSLVLHEIFPQELIEESIRKGIVETTLQDEEIVSMPDARL